MALDFTNAEKRTLSKLTTPQKIQTFIDQLTYNADDEDWFRCPLNVMRDRKGHCFEGAVFAALALEKIGFPPLIVNLYPEPGTDDEHVIAVYQKYGAWGAIALSNYVGLRSREPIYRNLRELVISYFENYYNLKNQKTLRSYTHALNLKAFEKKQWRTSNETMHYIGDKLDSLKRFALLKPSMVKGLSRMNPRYSTAGIFGSKSGS